MEAALIVGGIGGALYLMRGLLHQFLVSQRPVLAVPGKRLYTNHGAFSPVNENPWANRDTITAESYEPASGVKPMDKSAAIKWLINLPNAAIMEFHGSEKTLLQKFELVNAKKGEMPMPDPGPSHAVGHVTAPKL